ncbi:hypothetical protein JCM3775_003076 [Rhodotorula graminis]|uniref:Glycosylphosphatidylinositol anchor biosynthesis protein 11 n=1 Tax=Rhodotorula graminis (strain WP1) TaxID=578459 RepID=A0A194S762_RHOGW|nr:uncharacterized protein RHOBADRAFT_52554 [Rhodotorula graminis WP1]KPV76563.1 hypothetical protein RHOBADRAFT_52554 [Rhodotorula graminis WP1]
MARTKPKSTLEPSRNPPTPSLSSTSSSSSFSRPQQPELVPVRHYLPRVPLQLFAVAFSLVAASTSQDKHLAAPARFLQALHREPLKTLPVVCAALAAIQTWFAYSLRSNRIASLARLNHKGTDAPAPAPSRAAAARGTGFRGSLATMWDAAMRGEAPTEALWKKRALRRGAHAKAAIDTSFVGEAIMVTWLGTLAIHACTVLLGAPLTSNLTSTYLFSLLVSILAILPLAIALPLSDTSARFVWLRLASTFTPTDDLELALFAPALGTLVGAWLGAVPIPLDWDRPWQQWPTTPVLGALAGHALGSLVALARIAYGGVVRAAVDVLEEAGQQQQQQQQRGAQQGQGREGGRRKLKGQ